MPAPLPLDDPERRRRWPWVTLVLLLLAGAAVAAFLLTRPDEVRVPNVVGRQGPQAYAMLADAKLKPQVHTVKSDKLNGVVVRQDPGAGAKVEKLSTVKLFISGGPGTTIVPDVVNKTEAEAVKLLKKRRLLANISSEQSQQVPKGLVIRTNPVAFNSVPVGSRVDLVISSGPQQVRVPAVIGKQQPEAKALLQDARLRVTTVQQDSNQPKDQVLSQAPAAGTTVNRGSRVTITVSRGTPKVEVPDVTGRSKDEASGILQGAGFTVAVKEIKTTDPTQVGKVIRQKPGARSQRKKGSPVTIYVGKQSSSPAPGTGGGTGGTGGGSPGTP
jgi:serine/threonine-protein kinase